MMELNINFVTSYFLFWALIQKKILLALSAKPEKKRGNVTYLYLFDNTYTCARSNSLSVKQGINDEDMLHAFTA